MPHQGREARIIAISKVVLKLIPLILAVSLLPWALVRHGEQSLASASCEDRLQRAVGFEGDPDFYGLGIRVGLYLQWISSFVTNCFTPNERRAVLTSYAIFNLSITAATLARVFGEQCTFAAELFVVLTMFWGGLNIVIVPVARAIGNEDFSASADADFLRNYNRRWQLRWSLSLLQYIMSSVTVWFWARLAAVDYQVFAPTPGGNSVFFFARFQGASIKGLSIFMAVASAINFVWLTFTMLPLQWDPNPDHSTDEIEPKVGGAIWLVLSLILSPIGSRIR